MFEIDGESLRGQRVVVVGGGVIGTLHAYQALARGADVVHLERDLVPQGATVRNFGLVWVSGRARGRELDLALRARELWGELARDNEGVGFRANGSLTLVNRDDETSVIEHAMNDDDAQRRGFELLSAEQVRRKNPALCGEFSAGLFCRLDAAVESAKAMATLRTAMQRSDRYDYLVARELVGVADHAALDHRGVVHKADRVFLCLGASLSGFAAELFELEALRTVRLQMAETEPFGRELTTSIANGDSLRYYPAYQDFARSALSPQNPEAARHAIQLLCQQRLHGGLTFGDTHELDEPGRFALSDRPVEILFEALRALIGSRTPRIDRRWVGSYHQLSDPMVDEIYFRKEVAPGVVAVTGAGGRGMTLAPAIAEESFQ